MKTIITETKVYKYDELTEEQKDKALEHLWDLNVNYEWWEFTYEDAERAGLAITGFDLDRNKHVDGTLTHSIEDSIEAILSDHGDKTDTYRLAAEYKTKLVYDEDDELVDRDELERDYTYALREEYASMLQRESEYLTSKEAIVETIRANDYDFTENGKLF